MGNAAVQTVPDTQSPDAGENVEYWYRQLKGAQMRMNAARLEMGGLLELIRRDELWQGKAESFQDFLEEERITRTSAYQYMRVMRKIYFELDLSDVEMAMLSVANMRVLDEACKIMTRENKDQLISMLITLSAEDALSEISSMRIAQGMKGNDWKEEFECKCGGKGASLVETTNRNHRCPACSRVYGRDGRLIYDGPESEESK